MEPAMTTKQRQYVILYLKDGHPSFGGSNVLTGTLYEYFEGLRKMNESLRAGMMYQPSVGALAELKELENASA